MRASRSRRLQSFGIARNLVGQHLERDLAPERSIARAIDLAHASRAKEGEDLVATNRPSHPRWRTIRDQVASRDIER